MATVTLRTARDRSIEIAQEAVHAAIDLEARGYSMRVENGVLRVSGNPAGLSQEDRATITRNKFHLIAIVETEWPAAV